MSDAHRDTRPAWFGKIPAEGEFFARRLGPELALLLEAWLRDGMRSLAEASPDDWRERFLVAPLWHFLMAPGIWGQAPVLGCVAPSMDKFGRTFPLTVLQVVVSTDVCLALPPRSDWLHRVDGMMRACIGRDLSPDVFDHGLQGIVSEAVSRPCDSTLAILSDLGIAAPGEPVSKRLPWPELPALYGSHRQRSYWWAETAPTRPMRQFIHSGQPDAALFELLFGYTS